MHLRFFKVRVGARNRRRKETSHLLIHSDIWPSFALFSSSFPSFFPFYDQDTLNSATRLRFSKNFVLAREAAGERGLATCLIMIGGGVVANTAVDVVEFCFVGVVRVGVGVFAIILFVKC
jgi:hypothetical protein